MRTIYIDTECKAHVSDNGTYAPLVVDMLDGFCDEYIEGHIIVPNGSTAIHPD